MFLSKISQFYYQLLLGLNENGWVTLLLSMFSLSLKILREMVLTLFLCLGINFQEIKPLDECVHEVTTEHINKRKSAINPDSLILLKFIISALFFELEYNCFTPQCFVTFYCTVKYISCVYAYIPSLPSSSTHLGHHRALS